MSTVDDGTMTFKAFARVLGCSPSYVTQLKDEGRLVLSSDGKRVCVDESLARIRASADPAKEAVADRHAKERGAPLGGDAGDEVSGEDEGGSTGDQVALSHSRRKQKALADRAETEAKVAERDYLISMEQLLDATAVEHAVRRAVTSFRASLEQLPNTLAPELAAIADEGRIRVVMAEAFEYLLEELSRGFAAIGKKGEPR